MNIGNWNRLKFIVLKDNKGMAQKKWKLYRNEIKIVFIYETSGFS